MLLVTNRHRPMNTLVPYLVSVYQSVSNVFLNKVSPQVIVVNSTLQGTVLVRATCKHLVEETATNFPLSDDVKVDTRAQQLMVFLQAPPIISPHLIISIILIKNKHLLNLY
jgi:hypothetical protein